MADAADAPMKCHSYFKLGINTDEVAYLDKSNWLVVGGYQLLDGATQQKRGLISVHSVQFDPQPRVSHQPSIEYAFPEGGVFQLEADLQSDNGVLWASLSQGDIVSMGKTNDEQGLMELSRLKFRGEEGAAGSSSAAVACTGIHHSLQFQLDSCYSDGSIRVWSLDGGGSVRWQCDSAHEMEAWQVIRMDPNMLVSCGDDAAFCFWDIRLPGSSGPVSSVRSFYQGGVTSLAMVDQSTPYYLAVGSYDETMSVWDLRKLSGRRSQPLASLPRLGGGVWRLKKRPNPPSSTNKVRFLAACMHDGWKVIDIDCSRSDDSMLNHVRSFDYPSTGDSVFPHHLPSALAYGACWISEEWAAGCSFYDNVVSCWQIPRSNKDKEMK